MDVEQVHVGQRVRINVPGIGDHRQAGTLKKVQGGKCYVHLDWAVRRGGARPALAGSKRWVVKGTPS